MADATRLPGRPGRWTPAIVSATLLFVGSAMPLPPRFNPEYGWYGPDKVLHLLGHAVFTGLLLTSIGPHPRGGTAVVAVATSTGFGLGIELVQEFVPGRAFERADVTAGLLGSFLGLLGWHHFDRGARSSH